MNVRDKIGVISISDNLGGAEQVLFKIAKFYMEQGSEVFLFFIKPQTNNFWQRNLASITEFNYINNNFLSLFKQFKEHQFKTVFSSHLMMNALLGACRTLSILKTNKLICRESTTIFGRYKGTKLIKYKLAYWFGYRNVDLIITQTSLMKDILIQKLSYLEKRSRVETIPNPFDFPNNNVLNDEIEIPEDTIISAGRLIPEKGFDYLIKAFAKVVQANSEMKLMILGEGQERNNLEKLISDLNLTQKVILKGHVNNVYPYFKKAKACVVSSVKEGFPNVLLQMMSQNNKVISTLCAGDIDQIKGLYLSEVKNIESLYLAIMASLSSDTLGVRDLFNTELYSRSMEKFMYKVEGHVK